MPGATYGTRHVGTPFSVIAGLALIGPGLRRRRRRPDGARGRGAARRPPRGRPAPDDDRLAYFSWHAGGFRVVDITDPANPIEVGHDIDPAGNNSWGVALAEDQSGDRIVLASDRDCGLFMFRYTGPLP